MASDWQCKLCGGRLVPYAELPVYRCVGCELIQLCMSDEEEEAWRSKYSDSGRYSKEFVCKDHASFSARLAHDRRLAYIRMENILRLVSDDLRGVLLDVGSGNGALLDEAAGRGFMAIGIEPDQWTISTALPMMLHDVEMICSTFEACARSLPIVADVVTFIDSFEHLLDPHAALEVSRSMLGPKGAKLLVLEMPDADAPGFQAEGSSWRHFKPEEHAFLWGKRHVERLLDQHQLRLIDTIMPYPDRRVYYARAD